jgi:hypothetical protein
MVQLEVSMKKLLIVIAISVLFASMSTVISIPFSKPSATGTFEGNVGYYANHSWVPIGNISGTFTNVGTLGYRPGSFNGAVTLNNGDITGTIHGYYRMMIFGSASVNRNGTEQKLPIIGILGANHKGEFNGILCRFMSYSGPLLYIQGNYQ